MEKEPEMYHSITFTKNGTRYNTWDDWRLIAASAPVIAPPVERTIQLNVPGRNGSVDLSQSLTGHPVFDVREGTWYFYADVDTLWDPDKASRPVGHGLSRMIAEKLMEFFNDGMSAEVRLEDDPGFYYTGRVWMSDKPDVDKNHPKLAINYRLYPYKFPEWSVEKDWVWDDFNFEGSPLAVPYLKNIEIKAEQKKAFFLPPSEKPAKINVTASGATLFSPAKAVLRMSRLYPYDEAKAKGLPAEEISRTIPGVSLFPMQIGSDLRYDVYELILSAAKEVVMNVSYEPAYF